jgi:hypothetical protein
MLREEVVRGGVEPPTFRFSGFVCGLPVVSPPEAGLVGLLWGSARHGLERRSYRGQKSEAVVPQPLPVSLPCQICAACQGCTRYR